MTCDANSVAAVAGVATFAGCKINTAGTGYALTASSGNLTTADSPSFPVAATSTPCQAGTYGGSGGTSPCNSCLPGTYQPNTGQTSCLAAPRGRYVSDYGATEANLCLGGRFAATEGNTQCTNCPSGQNSNADRTACVAPRLDFDTQPVGAEAGVAFATQPVVSVGPGTTSVTLAIKANTGASGARLTCSANPVTVVAGLATFTSCKIDTVGTGYVLIASADGITAESQALDIAGFALKSLTISRAGTSPQLLTLSPAFSESVREYTVTERLPTGTQVTITATANQTQPQMFVYRPNGSATTLGSTLVLLKRVESVTDTATATLNMPLTDELRVRVRRLTAGSSESWYTLKVRQFDPPGAPTNVTVVPGSAQAKVSWQAPADTGGADASVLSYTVSATQSGGNGTGSCNSTAGGTTCTVTGLGNGNTYTFTVAASNSAGTGTASSGMAALIGAPPGKPGKPRIVDLMQDNYKVKVAWEAASGGASPETFDVSVAGSSATCQATFKGAADLSHECELDLVSAGGPWTFTVTARNSSGTSVSDASDSFQFSAGGAQCGSANRVVFTAAPGPSKLCTSGSASAVTRAACPNLSQSVTSAGPCWAWTCTGTRSSSASCATSGESPPGPFAPPPRRPPAKKK